CATKDMLADQHKESAARVASIMENTNLSNHQQVFLIMRQMPTLSPLSLHDALPILSDYSGVSGDVSRTSPAVAGTEIVFGDGVRSEEHTSELQSPCNLVCRLLLEKKKKHQSF